MRSAMLVIPMPDVILFRPSTPTPLSATSRMMRSGDELQANLDLFARACLLIFLRIPGSRDNNTMLLHPEGWLDVDIQVNSNRVRALNSRKMIAACFRIPVRSIRGDAAHGR